MARRERYYMIPPAVEECVGSNENSPLRAISGRKHVQQCWCSRANLFDHLVGVGEQRRRHLETEGMRSARAALPLRLAVHPPNDYAR